ncbi:uncharacterized protein C2845_PM05G09880 [Panicum miliaceum]|uniref:F-box domain-containing protein n=1 Tax=Panicum miliaceum TaxID=4540 RepID=A0A3L6T5R0_PANMI|nr:uncharacterized protein C2845_PM05G09880 [Panicum miliaceum]
MNANPTVILFFKPPTATFPGHRLQCLADQDQDEDRISALPDHILLDILERLDLHTAIQSSTLSRRWAHLPRSLSRLLIHVAHFLPRGRKKVMTAYTVAVRSLLLPSSPTNDRTIKHLELSFYLTESYLQSIGHAVANATESGKTNRLDLIIWTDVGHPEYEQWLLFGERLMSFFQSFPTAFKWLTRLTLRNITFGETDIHNLLSSCNKLELLSLTYCDAVINPITSEDAILTIDAPHSALLALEVITCGYARVDLIQVPNLRRLVCANWIGGNPPLVFGNVPQLDNVALRLSALHWQTPFTLSHCFANTTSLSAVYLNFYNQMIWIEPEGPKHLFPIFSNLREIYLYNIFYDCDLNWTMFVLEAAPSLNDFCLMLSRHPCGRGRSDEDGAKKVNVSWDQAPPDFKHHRLSLLHIIGFAVDEKLVKYIRLVMERAVGLRRICLLDQKPCDKCDAMDDAQSSLSRNRWRFPVEEEKEAIRQQLVDGFSSSVEISIG